MGGINKGGMLPSESIETRKKKGKYMGCMEQLVSWFQLLLGKYSTSYVDCS